MYTLKAWLSVAAIGLTLSALVPYLLAVWQGKIKPHVFSWVIWGTTTVSVFGAQVQANAGVGAWPIGLSGILTLVVAVLAFKRRTDISITRGDWLFFLTALAALPLWFITQNPLWAVCILTLVDVLGFGPTLRKAYAHPYSESIGFFSLFMLRNILAALALEHYSLTTALFPVTIAFTCLGGISLMAFRRWQLATV